MHDIRQTSEYGSYLSRIGWTVETINGVNFFIKKFPIIGSAIKIQRPEKLRYKDIEILSKKYRAFQIIIEPKNEAQISKFKFQGFKQSKSTYLPSKTLELDLTKSENKIFENFKKDCRSAIKKNEKLELKEYNLKNLSDFRVFWKKAIGIKRYISPLWQLIEMKKAFKNNSLFVTSKNGESGAIFLKADKKAYYWQAFTDCVGRKKNYQYKIVWEGILWAKKHGTKMFDFEGIYDSRFPNKSWLGFTHFKKSFNGEEKEYPGCFIRFRFPI